MMKKRIVLSMLGALCLAVLCSLAGCGNGAQIRGTQDGKAGPGQPRYGIKADQDNNLPQWEKTANAIIQDGLKYWGAPYVYGAERFNDKAFDCSSYVQYLYAKHGIRLGYNAREQAVQGEEVPFINLRKGDLMFFSDEDFPNETGLSKVRHVGIYMGDGQILHTYEPGIGVVISNIHKDQKEGEYWYQHYLFARRVIPG